VSTNVGIAEMQELRFSVWPNPATDVLHIESGTRLQQIRLLDMRGREAAPPQPSATGGEERATIDVSALPSGLYLLQITDAEGRKGVQKVIKQ